MINVIATFKENHQFGFYGNRRRRNGEKFSINSEKEYSEKWMTPASKADEKKLEDAKKKPKKQ